MARKFFEECNRLQGVLMFQFIERSGSTRTQTAPHEQFALQILKMFDSEVNEQNLQERYYFILRRLDLGLIEILNSRPNSLLQKLKLLNVMDDKNLRTNAISKVKSYLQDAREERLRLGASLENSIDKARLWTWRRDDFCKGCANVRLKPFDSPRGWTVDVYGRRGVASRTVSVCSEKDAVIEAILLARKDDIALETFRGFNNSEVVLLEGVLGILENPQRCSAWLAAFRRLAHQGEFEELEFPVPRKTDCGAADKADTKFRARPMRRD